MYIVYIDKVYRIKYIQFITCTHIQIHYTLLYIILYSSRYSSIIHVYLILHTLITLSE